MEATVPTSAGKPRPAAGAGEDPGVVGVRSVDRALSLLLALGSWDGEAGVTDMARSLGLHKSTASRLLATLQKRGLVEQDRESGRYRLGLALVRLGGRAEKTLDLRSIARKELEGLAAATMEAVTLGVLEGDSVETIAWSYPPGLVHARSGRTMPLHATASGKVLLSTLPERDIVRISNAGFAHFTPYTIVRLDLLLDELARVRKRGFATSFGEHQPGVNAVAVAVTDARGSIVAALEVRAAGNRISPSRVAGLAEKTRDAAAAVSEMLGGAVSGTRSMGASD
jgi:DNA-binding IclR family transcriptional regulator